MKKDTICAISTPPGISGIGIIRLSGPDTYRIIEEIFVPGKPNKKKKIKVKEVASHTVHYGHIIENGQIVDEVLLTIMKSPKTYTREDMAEIGCHGGLIPLKEVINICIKKGARLASPGEFTMRAFLNGRIDLTQAESVLEIINSPAEKSLEMSLKKLEGEFSKKVKEIRHNILDIMSKIEATIDFPEEEDVSKIEINIEEQIKEVKEKVEKIIESGLKGKIFYEGIKAAIVGRANVGKSSLLNKLLNEDRAIVTEIPGTTRDVLQETINIKGIPLKIIDTAGIRKTRGKIEKMGVERAVEWMRKAEMNILVLDGSEKLKQDDKKLIEKVKKKIYLIVINKIDLPVKIEMTYLEKIFPPDRIVKISAKEGRGIESLKEKIYILIQKGYNIETGEFYLNLREEDLLKKIKKSLENAFASAKEGQSLEVIAEDLREAINNIDYLTGKRFNEEMLEKIFSNFCIGK